MLQALRVLSFLDWRTVAHSTRLSRRTEHVCWPAETREAHECRGLSITECLGEISSRLTDAAAVAKAAVVCAETGSEREALRIAMDLDELLHDAVTLHGAATLIGRIERREALRTQSDG